MEPEPVIELVTVYSSRSPRGRSRKPGNILLNWRKLIDVVPDATLAGVGATANPQWTIPLVGLYIWNKFWRGAEEELSDVEATVILALWKGRNSENKIGEDEGFVKTNEFRSTSSLPTLSRDDYTAAINRLLIMKCIEISDGIIWLREWVNIRY
jgi:hypothetical protein